MVVIGLSSNLIPNIPLVVAKVLLLKEYVVNVWVAVPRVLSPNLVGQLAPEVLPLFYNPNHHGRAVGGGSVFVVKEIGFLCEQDSRQRERSAPSTILAIR
jgi:hypothetical protein